MPDQPAQAETRAILHTLQDEIRRHRVALGEDVAVERPDPLGAVRDRQRVNSHLPIGWPVMPKGLWPKLVAYAQKITRRLLRWYINPLVDQQNTYNIAVTEALADMVSRQGALAASQVDLSQRLGRVEDTVRDLLALHQQSEEQMARLAAALDDVHRRELDDLSARAEMVEDAVRQLQAAQEARAAEQRSEQRDEVLRARVQRLEDWQRRGGILQAEATTAPTTPQRAAAGPGPDYFLLGLEHRSAADLTARLGDYDDLFTDLLAARERGEAPAGPILDIGCGRGEFVEHLGGLGLPAYGIEIDRDAILAAQEAADRGAGAQGAGRDVREADAFAHLESLADDTLGGVVMIQVIEHFAAEDLLALFRLIRRKLAPGGLLLAETINPLVFAALSSAYLLDPSHETPLPPRLTRFLLEQAGLWRVEIRLLRPVPAPTRLEPLPAAPENALVHTLNDNIERLNALLYGPQDYAAIAWKPKE